MGIVLRLAFFWVGGMNERAQLAQVVIGCGAFWQLSQCLLKQLLFARNQRVFQLATNFAISGNMMKKSTSQGYPVLECKVIVQ